MESTVTESENVKDGNHGAFEGVAILGGGNIGRALALGWTAAGVCEPEEVIVTRRQVERLESLADQGFCVTDDNLQAVQDATVVVAAVQPQQLASLLREIASVLGHDRHVLVSVVSDVTVAEIRTFVGDAIPVVRAMPNTAIAVGEAMTTLSAPVDARDALARVRPLFEAVGQTLEIREEMMLGATALCACGTAFFLRAVRAASQGGIEIGFHPEEAVFLAAQTARGAASLVLADESHPESEIDRVTTPRGCTIAGLNEMEHQGFSSALIKGIVRAAKKAADLYQVE